MTFIKGHPTSTPVVSILTDIYWAELVLAEITMILLTKSTAVSHKYLYDKLKLLCYNFSLKLHRIPRVFHVQRNPWVFQVCVEPWQTYKQQPNLNRSLFTTGLLTWEPCYTPWARLTKYLMTILWLLYDNTKAATDLRWMSNLQIS